MHSRPPSSACELGRISSPTRGLFLDEVDAASGAGGDWRRDVDGDDSDAGVVIGRNRRDSSWCCAPATSYSCNEGFAVANNRGHFISVCVDHHVRCLLYTSPSPRDGLLSRMPSSA